MRQTKLAEVHHISTKRKKIPIQEWRDLVRFEAWTYARDGGTYKRIAAQTGLAPATVSKLACGETRFPRFETVIAVLKFFGYDIYLSKEK